jgi:hypothetical protein
MNVSPQKKGLRLAPYVSMKFSHKEQVIKEQAIIDLFEAVSHVMLRPNC